MMLAAAVKNILLRPIIAALTVGGLLCVPLSPSWADVEIVAQRIAGSGQTPPVSQVVKLSYKGPNARLEVVGEPILLYDGKDNILYGLDAARKTYYMTVPTQTEPTDLMPSEIGGEDKENVKLDLHQTDQTMLLAGMTAHQYTVTGTVTFTRSRPEGSRRGGGGRRRGGGGFPGGGFPLLGPATVDQNGGGGYGRGPEGGDRNSAFAPPQWSLSGELWLSDTLKFPAQENTLLAAQLVAASAGPFQQPLADALDKHKGLPLLARITVTAKPASAGSRAASRSSAGPNSTGVDGKSPPVTTVTTFRVQSVSSGPLNDRIFQAPLDYTLVAAPLNAYSPGDPPATAALP